MARKSTAPIDRGWAWMVAFAVFVDAFFMMGIIKSSGIFMVEFMDRFNVSTVYAGIALTATLLLFAFGALITGAVGEKVTHRKVMIFGGIVGMLGLSLSSLLFSMPYVIVFYALGLGIGNSCSYGSGMVMIGKYFRKKRSTATGIGLSGTSLGQFAMPPIIEFLLATYGLGGTLLVIGALYLHCSLAGALLRPIENYEVDDSIEGEQQDHQFTGGEDSLDKTGVEQKPDDNSLETEMLFKDGLKEGEDKSIDILSCPRISDLQGDIGLTNKSGSCDDLNDVTSSLSNAENKNIIISDIVVEDSSLKERKNTSVLKTVQNYFRTCRNYLTVHFVFVSFCAFLAIVPFTMFVPAIAVDRGLTKYQRAMLVSLSGIGDFVARLTTGYLADRNFIPRYKLKCLTTIVGALNIIVFIFANSFYWMGVHCFIIGLASGAYVCLMPVVILDFLSLEVLSTVLGLTIFAMGLAGCLGQLFLGYIRDLTGSYTAVLTIEAVSMLVCGMLLLCTPFVSRLEQKRTGTGTLQTGQNETEV